VRACNDSDFDWVDLGWCEVTSALLFSWFLLKRKEDDGFENVMR